MAAAARGYDLIADVLEEAVVIDNIRLSRRQLLKLGIYGAALSTLSFAGFTLAACDPASRPMRRDIVSLPSGDPILTAYRDAVAAMKALPMTDRRNWTRQAEIHQNFCPHGNWLFLPWHRAYLRYFEDICRQLSGMTEFALPYWNWQKDQQIPAAFWDPAGGLTHTPRSATTATSLSPSVFGASNIESILSLTNFLLFASGAIPQGQGQRTPVSQGPLEAGPHNTLHGTVGGTMASYMSPLDPIFWTHHNVIDAIWIEWNIKRGNPNTSDAGWVNQTFTEFCDKDGNPVEVTVLQTVLYPYFVYQFDNPVLGMP